MASARKRVVIHGPMENSGLMHGLRHGELVWWSLPDRSRYDGAGLFVSYLISLESN